MKKAMIISLGGSPEPIVKTILDEGHRPEFVCFLASDDSANLIGKIREDVSKGGLSYNQKLVITEDPMDLVECYKKSLKCFDFLFEKGYSSSEAVVDITGGTKIMTAALAMAAIGKGFKFSYVGGSARTKDGLGTVISGTEFIKEGVGPWHIFAVEEKRALSTHINSYRFDTALEILKELKRRGKVIRSFEFFEPLGKIVQGYIDWEAFRHGSAMVSIKNGLDQLRERLAVNNQSEIRKYVEKVVSNYKFLDSMKKNTKDFTKLSRWTVIDLLSNAERCGEMGKYDDAIARVYRSLEMLGQIEFIQEFKCSNSEVDPKIIPEKLRKEYECTHKPNKDGKIQLALKATFRVLNEVNNKFGKKLFEKLEDVKKLQSARNNSILAHGVEPTSEKGYNKMLKLVRELSGINEKIQFPRLESNW